MELNSLMQALAKDLAEQLRPMVAEMVKQELANTEAWLTCGDTVLENIAHNIDLSRLAGHLSMADLAGELTDSQLTIIAGDVDLADLAGEFDAEKLAEAIDLDSAISDWFSDQSFTIKTN